MRSPWKGRGVVQNRRSYAVHPTKNYLSAHDMSHCALETRSCRVPGLGLAYRTATIDARCEGGVSTAAAVEGGEVHAP